MPRSRPRVRAPSIALETRTDIVLVFLFPQNLKTALRPDFTSGPQSSFLYMYHGKNFHYGICYHPSVINAYLRTNTMEIIHVRTFTSFAFPVKSFIRQYMIRPTATPFAIEYVNGINTTVQNAGSAFVISLKSTSLMLLSIRIPTKIRAGTVAAPGTIPTTGAKIMEPRNRRAVTRLVIPVLPPAAIPALDSTTVVTVEVRGSYHCSCSS